MTKLTKGLYTDVQAQDQPQGTYRFAKNALITDQLAAVQNEPGFTALASVSIPYTLIGVIEIEDAFVTFSTDNNTNHEIGLVESGVYTTIYSNSGLSFNTANPIKGEFYKNFQEERVISWIDDINIPRILNIDDVTITDINDLALFPDSNIPNIVLSILESGGSLVSGTYQIVTRYEDIDGTTTDWFNLSRPIYITEDTINVGADNFDGVEANTKTGKAIQIDLSNVDTNYSYITIGVISTIDGIVEAKKIRTLDSSSSITVNYTGSEVFEELSLDEILVPSGTYTNAKAITQLNNRLYLGNLESDDFIDFQQYANDIEINYKTTNFVIDRDVNNKADPIKTFRHGEVYAFYIVLILNNGQYSQAFHIPGRDFVGLDVVDSSLAITQGLPGRGGNNPKVFEYEDTTDQVGASTNMGFWENDTEVYPSGFPDFAGEKVRHHKFPSIEKLRGTTYVANSSYGRSQLDQLTIDVTNVNIPANIQSKIQGWKIVYAKRDINNSTILDQTIYQPAANPAIVTGLPPFSPDLTTIWTSAGNWEVRTGASPPGIGKVFVDERYMRLVPFASLHSKYNISGVSYLSAQLKLKTGDLSIASPSGENSWDGLRNGAILEGDNDETWSYLSNYASISTTVSQVPSDDFLRPISEIRYNPFNSLQTIGGNDFINTEECITAKMGGTGDYTNLDLSTPYILTNVGGGFTSSDNLFEETYLLNLNQKLNDLFTSFSGQQLVETDKQVLNPATTSLSDIGGGDTFLCSYSYVTMGPRDFDDQVNGLSPSNNGTIHIKNFVCESSLNINLRYEDPSDNGGSLYYPKSNDITIDSTTALNSWIIEYIRTTEPNQKKYNSDYSILNDKISVSIFKPNQDFVNKFPYTIIRSGLNSTESSELTWKNFASGDRFTQPRDKGEIINLQGIRNEDLLIHHEFSLYKTKTNTSLSADGVDNIVLGSSDIFALKPEEILSTNEGYAGTQHVFSCLLTKAGYCFTDASQGKIFLYNSGRLDEISSKGTRNFFRDTISNSLNDNPFTDTGITIGYDEKYNRILWAQKAGANSFTASYSPYLNENQGGWISFHDYLPDIFISLRKNSFLSFKNNSLFEHNTGIYGDYYDSPTLYPLIVDVVYNSAEMSSKLFTSLEWKNEVFDSSNLFQDGETFDFITIRNDRKTSDRIELEKFVNLASLYSTNVRQLETVWSFNKLRNIAINNDFTKDFFSDFNIKATGTDNTVPWYKQKRFIDKYLITRYEYSNLNNNSFYFLENNINFKPSYRGY